ncbi:hypothetical protein K4H04_24210, partial [Mycobacterium tuberculosis]|nr:hypothetical protein [Mycobacterium tuberculosis]
GYQISTIPAVNTLYNALLNHPEFSQLDLSKLVIANGGGMAIQEGVASELPGRGDVLFGPGGVEYAGRGGHLEMKIYVVQKLGQSR